MRKRDRGWRMKLATLVASAAGAAVLLVGWHGAQRTTRAALLQRRFAPAYALVERQPPSPYVQHPTRGLEYSEGQLPFDVSSVPGSKSICDWVYCPTSSEAIQVSRWTPAEERAGMANPVDVNDYAVTWTGWDYGTYGDVTNVYEPPDCIVKHLGPRTEPPKPCAVPGRKQEEDFSASKSSQHGMYAGAPVSEIDEKFGYQLPDFARRQGVLRRKLGARKLGARKLGARKLGAPMQSLSSQASGLNEVEAKLAAEAQNEYAIEERVRSSAGVGIPKPGGKWGGGLEEFGVDIKGNPIKTTGYAFMP